MTCVAHRARSRITFWKLAILAILVLVSGPHIGRHIADPEGTPLLPRPVAEFLARFTGQRTSATESPAGLQREVRRTFAAVDGVEARDAAIESALARESHFRPIPGATKERHGLERSYLPPSGAAEVIRTVRNRLDVGGR